jgi:hypothetical protein
MWLPLKLKLKASLTHLLKKVEMDLDLAPVAPFIASPHIVLEDFFNNSLDFFFFFGIADTCAQSFTHLRASSTSATPTNHLGWDKRHSQQSQLNWLRWVSHSHYHLPPAHLRPPHS